jgi:hypothetical protein
MPTDTERPAARGWDSPPRGVDLGSHESFCLYALSCDTRTTDPSTPRYTNYRKVGRVRYITPWWLLPTQRQDPSGSRTALAPGIRRRRGRDARQSRTHANRPARPASTDRTRIEHGGPERRLDLEEGARLPFAIADFLTRAVEQPSEREWLSACHAAQHQLSSNLAAKRFLRSRSFFFSPSTSAILLRRSEKSGVRSCLYVR